MNPEEVLEQEPVVEEPIVETPVEEPEPQPAPEPMQIYTRGEWADLELLIPQEMEVGKTYHIAVKGHCQFMISAEKPTAGITTNEITFTKQDGLKLWIKTGE
jgi:hypothetical protein